MLVLYANQADRLDMMKKTIRRTIPMKNPMMKKEASLVLYPIRHTRSLSNSIQLHQRPNAGKSIPKEMMTKQKAMKMKMMMTRRK